MIKVYTFETPREIIVRTPFFNGMGLSPPQNLLEWGGGRGEISCQTIKGFEKMGGLTEN